MELKEYKNINEKVYSHTFNNGLKLNFIKKEGFKSFYVGLLVKFGSIVTKFTDGSRVQTIPTGVAHFLEHKLFSSADGEDITFKFSELGLDVNAGTNFQTTVYYFSGINNFDKGVNLLLDFVQTPRYTEESVESEKDIIIQELLMYKDSPNERLYFGTLENLFESYPIRNDVCGKVEDIRSTTKDILDLCHKTFYHPSNMEIVISGDLDPDYVLNLIEQNQSSKSFVEYKPVKVLFDDDKAVIKKSSINMDITVPKISVGFKFPYSIEPNLDKNYIKEENLLWKMVFVFAFGNRTKFAINLIDEGLADDFLDLSLLIDKHTGFFSISADTKEPEKLIKRIKNRVRSIAKIKLNREIFELEKRTIYGSFVKSTASVYGVSSLILDNIEDNTEFFHGLEFINSITPEMIEKRCASLKDFASTIFTIYPNSKDQN